MATTRLLRIARGWTQAHLAAVSGVSVRTIQRIETGLPPSPETLLALAAAFDCFPDEIAEPPAGDGPHVHLTQDNLDPWPGLRLRIFKDGYQMGGCIELDSRRRIVRQIGFPHLVLDIPEADYEHRVQYTYGTSESLQIAIGFQGTPAQTLKNGAKIPAFAPLNLATLRFVVDGQPYNPFDHIQEVRYDAVLVYGHFKAIKHYKHEIPRHFVPIPRFDGPDPFPDEPPHGSGDPDYPWVLELPSGTSSNANVRLRSG